MNSNMRLTMRKSMLLMALAVVLSALLTPLVSKACGGGPMTVNAPTTRLWIGAAAMVNVDASADAPLALHATPDLYGTFIDGLPYGTVVKVVDGPVRSEWGYLYWKVVTADNKLTGWVAEGEYTVYWLKPMPLA